MSNNVAFDPNKAGEAAFFEKFMREVTPPSEIIAYATNGAALTFRSVDGKEFDAIQKKSSAFIKMVSTGRGLPPDWAQFQTKDAGALFKLFFLWETMTGWYEESKLVTAEGDDIPEGEDPPLDCRRVPVRGENDALRREKWDHKGWLWFRHQSPVAFAGIEAQALNSQAANADEAEIKAVSKEGEGTSATS